MKSDPTEMVTSMQMTVGFHCPIPVLFLLPFLPHNLILTIWFYSKHAYGSHFYMARVFLEGKISWLFIAAMKIDHRGAQGRP